MSQIKHLAVIMDGNRRWAKQRGLASHHGHRAGKIALEKMVRACKRKDIKYLTVFGFSTENWHRSKTEVDALIDVMIEALEEYADLLKKENVSLRVIGDIEGFPKKLKTVLKRVVEDSKKNSAGILTVALGYGGRDEIVRAASRLKSKTVTQATFEKALDTAGLPDPDLVIRTGGVIRLSGFLPWQIVYSELYFTSTLWPDFGSSHLNRALKSFAKRKRNFGK